MARKTLRIWSRGPYVVELQTFLKELGYDPGPLDGIFGPKVRKAVRAFQKDKGLSVDGIVGPKTWTALEQALAARPGENPTPQVYSRGSKGPGVRAMQELLIEWGMYPVFSYEWADGIYGKQTENAVKTLQRGMGLLPDGVAGEKTLAALYGPIIKPTHFGSVEFICHCLGKYCNGLPKEGIDPALLILLERIRTAAGDKPVIITSGYRCSKWNRMEGGATSSQHLYGRAADIKIQGMSVAEVNALCDRLNPYGGVGLGGQNITHVDVRGKKSRWWY